jgi:hypothetical protein
MPLVALRSACDFFSRFIAIQVPGLPLTEREPPHIHSLEIPTIPKKRLGLDEERSRIILSESNEIRWPGPDQRQD